MFGSIIDHALNFVPATAFPLDASVLPGATLNVTGDALLMDEGLGAISSAVLTGTDWGAGEAEASGADHDWLTAAADADDLAAGTAQIYAQPRTGDLVGWSADSESLPFALDGSDQSSDSLLLSEEPIYFVSNTPPRNDDEMDDPDQGEIIITARRSGASWGFTGIFMDAFGNASEPFAVAALSAGDVPDYIEWSDPTQPKENVPANPLITIVVVGNTMYISGKIAFEGPGAGAHTDGRLLNALNATWTRTVGQYTVITNMTLGEGGIVAKVAETLGNQTTLGLGGSVINTRTLDGVSAEVAAYHESKFAHEFGHVLGLMDLYGWQVSENAPGYDSGVMGGALGPPTEQTIRDLYKENGF
jgi:hypothetical protein